MSDRSEITTQAARAFVPSGWLRVVAGQFAAPVAGQVFAVLVFAVLLALAALAAAAGSPPAVAAADPDPGATFAAPLTVGQLEATSSTSLTVTWDETSSVGIASRSLQRQVATASGGACGTFADDGALSSNASPLEVAVLATGDCYRWVLTLTDGLGAVTVVTSGAVLVDTTPATFTVVVSGTAYQADGSTAWFPASGTGSLTVIVAATDPQSGVATVSFGSLTDTRGWTYAPQSSPGGDATVSLDYASALSTSLPVSVTNGAGTESPPRALSFSADGSAPTADFTSPGAGTTLTANTSRELVWFATDTAGGSAPGASIASASLQRQRGAIVTTGSCEGVTLAPDGAARAPNSNSLPVSDLASGFCYRWSLTLTDQVGNSGSSDSDWLLVDTAPPDVTVTATGNEGTGPWHLGPVTVSIAASDAESGLGTLTYTTAEEPTPQAYTAPFDYSAEGVTEIGVMASDVVHNERHLDAAVWIDSIAPEASFHQAFERDGQLVGLTLIDATSGIASYQVRRERSAYTFDTHTCGAFTIENTSSLVEVAVGQDYGPTSFDAIWPDSPMVSGFCYRWQVRVSDHAGNTSAWLASGEAVAPLFVSQPQVVSCGSGSGPASPVVNSSGTIMWPALSQLCLHPAATVALSPSGGSLAVDDLDPARPLIGRVTSVSGFTLVSVDHPDFVSPFGLENRLSSDPLRLLTLTETSGEIPFVTVVVLATINIGWFAEGATSPDRSETMTDYLPIRVKVVNIGQADTP